VMLEESRIEGPCPDATVKFRRNERAPHGVRLGSPHTRTPDERR
jgi:hypothetical protein